MLSLRDLLEGSPRAASLEPIIAAAEACLRSWQPQWTGFLDGALREEAEQRLAGLSELRVEAWGGYPGAERCRLLCQRAEAAEPLEQLIALPAELASGLELAGNFLFDPTEPSEFQASLVAAGGAIEELGDLWIRGDRGAQAIVASPLAERLHGQVGRVRTVEIR